MWPFKNKIKEETKRGLYGNRYNSSKNVSGWDGLGLIEQLCLIVLPCMLVFIFYIMLEMTGLIWWVRLMIAIGSVAILMSIITLLVNYLVEK